MQNIKTTIIASVISGLIVAAVIAYTKQPSKSKPYDDRSMA